MRIVMLLAAGALAALAGCSSTDATGPITPIDAAVNGTWNEALPVSAVGNSLQWTLRDSSGVITGTGRWAGEAGPFGTLSLNGAVAGDSVRFNITFVPDTIFKGLPPSTGRFVGVLSAVDEMSGDLTRAGNTSSVRFVRQR